MSAHDMFAAMGIPSPPLPDPVSAMPISRPTYTSVKGLDFNAWRDANETKLTEYWHQLVSPADGDVFTAADFTLFCLCQYDIELDRRDEFRRRYGSSRDL